MVKYSELFRVLKKDGWYKIGQLSIPYHAGKEVKKGLLKSILKQAGIKTGVR